MIPAYHKINGIFNRDNETGRFIMGQYSMPEFEYLAGCQWEFVEKCDGTNIRIGIDDAGEYMVGGRTDRAIIPKPLMAAIEQLQLEDKLRNEFSVPVTLYGEGYGHKIQGCGSKYLPDSNKFILFDINIGGIWLTRESVNDIANKLGLDSVPIIGYGSIRDGIDLVTAGFRSVIATQELQAEGIIAVPTVYLKARNGARIITKLKTKDFTTTT
jgi:hypothetical protein